MPAQGKNRLGYGLKRVKVKVFYLRKLCMEAMCRILTARGASLETTKHQGSTPQSNINQEKCQERMFVVEWKNIEHCSVVFCSLGSIYALKGSQCICLHLRSSSGSCICSLRDSCPPTRKYSNACKHFSNTFSLIILMTHRRTAVENFQRPLQFCF